MIKLCCILFTALLLFCLGSSGCRDKPEKLLTEQYLFYIGKLDDVQSLLMFNTNNGETTFACFDPLCRHTEESDCPFALVDYFEIEGDLIYYRKLHYSETGMPEWFLCTYDLTTMKTSHIQTIETTGKSGFAFFYQSMYYEECFTIENTPCYRSVDMRTGEIRTYEEIPVLPAEEHRLTDDYPVIDGQIFGQNQEVILSDIGYYIPFDDVIVCYVNETEPEYIGYCETTGKEIYSIYGGKLWIVHADTGESTVVETEEYLLTDVQMVGQKFVVSYGGFTDNLGRSLWGKAGRIVIDLTTGDMKNYPNTGYES